MRMEAEHSWAGRLYYLSWRAGARQLTWDEAATLCLSRGQQLLSLDTSAETEHFLQLLVREGEPWTWTGGRLDTNKTVVAWPGGREDPVQRGRFPWSDQGLRGPQPDGANSEDCVAILNNIYQDGVKLHDESCRHEKHFICETFLQ